jgi:trans-2,3-dihydro-3-hydroxyanthranilate isomerase
MIGLRKVCAFIDVFADVRYSGNQLAVFPNADQLGMGGMQKLANEINFSQTTFINSSKDPSADYEIRIFTPKTEMPFAGHPTIGTAYAIKDVFKLIPRDSEALRLKTKVGVISLCWNRGITWMTQNPPRFFDQYTNRAEIASLVNLSPENLSEDFPIEEVSTGLRILIVPINSLKAMQKATAHIDNLGRFFKDKGISAPYLFTLETLSVDSKVHTRFFAPHLGIVEDPATGSAAGPLIAYLLKHEIFGKSFDIQNEQGVEMGRPSRIKMRGKMDDNRFLIQVGGRCKYVGKGEYII